MLGSAIGSKEMQVSWDDWMWKECSTVVAIVRCVDTGNMGGRGGTDN